MSVPTTTIGTPPCISCGKASTFEVTYPQAITYTSGSAAVQDIFPDWPPAQREVLITGTHPECWDEMFGIEH